MSNQVIKRKFKLFVVEGVKWNFEDAFTHNIVVDIYGKSFMINVIFGNQTRLQLKVKLSFNILESDACNFFWHSAPYSFFCIGSISDNCSMKRNSVIKNIYWYSMIRLNRYLNLHHGEICTWILPAQNEALSNSRIHYELCTRILPIHLWK